MQNYSDGSHIDIVCICIICHTFVTYMIGHVFCLGGVMESVRAAELIMIRSISIGAVTQF